jgi:hypothetical protein
VPLLQDRADANLQSQNWRRGISYEGNEGIGLTPCPNLEHAQYDVLPVQRNGHCLFLCFVDILRERSVAGAPGTHQAMRKVVADYFDDHQGKIFYQGMYLPCDENIRTNGYGGVTEILAFAAIYNLSMEVHSPETPPYVQHFSFRPHGAAPELLLQTLGWDDSGRRAGCGDHWQRLRKKAVPAPAPAPTQKIARLARVQVLEQEVRLSPPLTNILIFRL